MAAIPGGRGRVLRLMVASDVPAGAGTGGAGAARSVRAIRLRPLPAPPAVAPPHVKPGPDGRAQPPAVDRERQDAVPRRVLDRAQRPQGLQVPHQKLPARVVSFTRLLESRAEFVNALTNYQLRAPGKVCACQPAAARRPPAVECQRGDAQGRQADAPHTAATAGAGC